LCLSATEQFTEAFSRVWLLMQGLMRVYPLANALSSISSNFD
jgi:hypothetical protein